MPPALQRRPTISGWRSAQGAETQDDPFQIALRALSPPRLMGASGRASVVSASGDGWLRRS